MAFPANDGTEFTLPMARNAHNARLASKEPPKPDDGPKDIEQDAQAMDLVKQLQQMGYSGEDVERAMGGGDEQEQTQDQGAEAAKAAPMMIPGTR